MARLLKQSEAKKLGLPGRTSLEPVSGAIGSNVTFRIAEIADAIAREATDIFRELDAAQGGPAEIKHLRHAS